MVTTHLFDIVARVSEVLADLERPWGLVGGLAVSVYVEPRFTRDIDIAISVSDDQDAEDFMSAWRTRGFVIDAVIEQDETERLATVRTYRPSSEKGIVVDLLFASSGIESEIANQAREMTIVPGLTIPVARPGHLFALKLLSFDPDTRPLDLVDIQNLTDLMNKKERAAAQRAVQLIEERGFDRGRDLSTLMDDHL